MRILFLAPAFPPFPGGGERYAKSLARELGQRGHSVTVVTSSAQSEEELWRGTAVQQIVHDETNGLQVIRCPLRPFLGGRNGLMAWRKGMVLISQLMGKKTAVLSKMARFIPPIQTLEETLNTLPNSFDLVHGFNISWEYAMLAGWHYAQAHQLPFVATPFTHFGVKGADRVARNSTMAHQLQMLSSAARILTLTTIEREGLIEWGLDATRIDVIWGGIEPLSEGEMAVSTSSQISAPYVIYIGRTSFDKGAIHAAQAICQLQAAGKNLHLVLIGQNTTEFKQFMDKRSAPEQNAIHHLGVVSNAEKHALLNQAQALLLPSRTDSFGLVLLEAWRHAVPVIGARAGGIPDVINDQENGLLVDFGDVAGLAQAIDTLSQDNTLRQQMGQAGKRKVETIFTWQKKTDRVLDTYQTLLGAL
jgi:glycogen synthase